MTKIVTYFSNVPDSHRLLLLAACILVFGNLEKIFAFKKSTFTLRRLLTNSLFMLTAAPAQILISFFLIQVIKFTTVHHFGLLNQLPIKLGNASSFLIGFVMLDLCEYVYHVIMHKVKRLWMFHLVHHSDRDLTVTSTLREHPIETTVRLSSLILWVFLLGVPFWVLLFRQFIQIVSNSLVHANFRLNDKVDSIVSYLFITPNMHQVHHHFKKPYTDKNYGDVLSIWDRIFGTFSKAKSSELVFGVDTYFDKKENTNFLTLLKIPFGKYRPADKFPNPN